MEGYIIGVLRHLYVFKSCYMKEDRNCLGYMLKKTNGSDLWLANAPVAIGEGNVWA